MTSVVWFRRDLRLTNNPALIKALEVSSQVILVYINSEEDSDFIMGGASKWWLHHSLLSLENNIADLSGKLNILSGGPKEVLAKIVKNYSVKNIFWNRMYEPEAVSRDKEIKSYFTDIGINCESYSASYLIEPWELKTTTGGPYQVFTPFWRALQKSYKTKNILSKPKSLNKSIEIKGSIKVLNLNLLPTIKWDKEFYNTWEPGEDNALRIVKGFLKNKVSKYKVDRDFPSIDGNSKLSPYLHFGEISPDQIWKLAEDEFKKGQITEVEPFIRQLGWRDFSNHLLFHFPHTKNKPLKSSFEKFPWSKNKKFLNAWQKGQTGFPIVDAGMRELWATGIMHNRVRMIAGSLLVKNLLIHWIEGAKWFYDTLVDADLSNNTMGWQWVAGSGADAAPYFRIFNPVSQSQRFDPEGIYIKKWIPELSNIPKKYIHAPWEAPDNITRTFHFTLGKDYPMPIVDLKVTRENALEAYYSLTRDKDR